MRALYGSDGTRNATHGSDSTTSAARELSFYFPHLHPDSMPTPEEADRLIEVYLQETLITGLTALAKSKPGTNIKVRAAAGSGSCVSANCIGPSAALQLWRAAACEALLHHVQALWLTSSASNPEEMCERLHMPQPLPPAAAACRPP